LNRGALQKVAAKLLDAGLARELKTRAGMVIWRRDDEEGQAYSLKLTAAGLKAATVDEVDSGSIADSATSSKANEETVDLEQRSEYRRRGAAAAKFVGAARRHEDRACDRIAPTRSGREAGRTDRRHRWLPHTARAALTGLRHRGYDVRLERGEKGRGSVYRASANLAMAS